ncbi:hypothetical protein RQP46_003479 [Phenoliferia psychrophenolica]
MRATRRSSTTPTNVLKLDFDLAATTRTAQLNHSIRSASSPTLANIPSAPTSSSQTTSSAVASPANLALEHQWGLAKYSTFSEKVMTPRGLLKRRKKDANFLLQADAARRRATVVHGTAIDQVEAALVRGSPSLAGFTFSHRTNIPGTATSYVDGSRRSFATRIECPESMKSMPAQLGRDVAAATSQRAGRKGISAMPTDGSRGAHEVRQIGVHREQGASLGYSLAFKRAVPKWTALMDGEGFKRVRGHVSRCLEIHYPLLFDYHRTLAISLAGVALHFLFGAFASFCINTGYVVCKPHVDTHNLGPGLCGVSPFDDFDSTRSGWLVLEEARLCVEVAAGDVFLFPSAIFTHWNTPLVGGDKRNSLAFWTGASLFLWSECGGSAFNRLPKEEQAARLARTKDNWADAWERFPIL